MALKVSHVTTSPFFSPQRRRLRPGRDSISPRTLLFLFSTPGIHDPKTICDPKWKTQLLGNKEANPTAKGRDPLQGRKTAFWRFPPPAQPAVRAPAPSQPVFLGGQAHLPGSVNSSVLLSHLSQSAGHPLPPGPGLFGNNGGNIKQGWKTGSESLNSQTGSLEGAGRREGPQGDGAAWGAWWRAQGQVSRMFSSCPTMRCPPALRGFLYQARSSP